MIDAVCGDSCVWMQDKLANLVQRQKREEANAAAPPATDTAPAVDAQQLQTDLESTKQELAAAQAKIEELNAAIAAQPEAPASPPSPAPSPAPEPTVQSPPEFVSASSRSSSPVHVHLEALQEDLEAARKTVEQQQAELDRLRGELAATQQQLEREAESKADSDTGAAPLADDETSPDDELSKLRAELQKAEETMASQSEQLAQTNAELQGAQTRLDALRQAIAEAEAMAAEELAAVQAELVSSQHAVESLQAEAVDREDVCEHVEREASEPMKPAAEFTALQERLTESESQYNDLQKQLNHLQSELDATSAARTEAEAELARIRAAAPELVSTQAQTDAIDDGPSPALEREPTPAGPELCSMTTQTDPPEAHQRDASDQTEPLPQSGTRGLYA